MNWSTKMPESSERAMGFLDLKSLRAITPVAETTRSHSIFALVVKVTSTGYESVSATASAINVSLLK